MDTVEDHGDISAADEREWLLIDWPLRPVILAALFGFAGLCLHSLLDGQVDVPWRMALAAFIGFGSLAIGLTLSPLKWQTSLIFSAIAGLILAGIAWRVTAAQETYADEAFWLFAGLISVGLAVPLFQAGFHKFRWNTSYEATHFHVWTDAISVVGAFAFTGLAWALIWLLSSLFELIQIDVLRELLREDAFNMTFFGVAFGAALGTLRNQLKVLGTLQSVVLLVLSLLAVPLAIALVIFLVAVLFSGLDVLWAATQSATPVLLSIATGCFILTNAVIRDDKTNMSGSRIMRGAALVLALGILPLTIFAAISMGTRIAQHGLSPERLWAIIAIAVACTYGVAYAVNAVRGLLAKDRAGWPDLLRQSNLHLGVAVCVIAFVLALPLFNFGAISARNQIARLNSGVVSEETFDYTALRWDFGEAGRRALKRLAQSDQDDVAQSAKTALRQDQRPYDRQGEAPDRRDTRLTNLRIEFDDPELREAMVNYVRSERWTCENPCIAIDLGPHKQGGRMIALAEGYGVQQFQLDPDLSLTKTDQKSTQPQPR